MTKQLHVSKVLTALRYLLADNSLALVQEGFVDDDATARAIIESRRQYPGEVGLPKEQAIAQSITEFLADGGGGSFPVDLSEEGEVSDLSAIFKYHENEGRFELYDLLVM